MKYAVLLFVVLICGAAWAVPNLENAKKTAREHCSHVLENLPDIDGKLHTIFRTCYLYNIEDTATIMPDGTTFVAVGGMGDQLWLRDSSAQMETYLPVARKDANMASLLAGMTKRHSFFILMDAYANSFRKELDFNDRNLGRGGYVATRNYEVDSLAYFIRFAYKLWRHAGTTEHFDRSFYDAALKCIIVINIEFEHAKSTYAYDELPNGGKGKPVVRTGMTWSGFRPSDDQLMYGYNIPVNMFVAVAMKQLAEIYEEVYHDKGMAGNATYIMRTIRDAIEQYGTSGARYVFEVDGQGNQYSIDDANVPSLLSIPYLDYFELFDNGDTRRAVEQRYLATRKYILSAENQYYFSGQLASGIGSPHTPSTYVWPMALAMQGMTSSDKNERMTMLKSLMSNAMNNKMVESFSVHTRPAYTRDDFGWANGLFAQLVELMYALNDFKGL